MATALGNVLPVFVIIAIGYLLRRLRFLNDPTAAGLSRLVFYVAAPLLLLRSTARSPLQEGDHLPTVGLVILVTTLMAGCSYFFLRRTRPSRRGVLAQGTHRSNMVFFGIPVLINTLGEESVGQVGLLIGTMVVVYNLLAVLLLTLPHRKLSARSRKIWVDALWQTLRNPLILGIAGGVLLQISGWRLPDWLDQSFAMVGQTAVPLALVTLGAGLDFARLRSDLTPAVTVSLLKLVVYPALIWFGLDQLGITGPGLQASVLICATPTAVVSYVMAREMAGDEKLAGAIVIASTLLAMVTIVGWMLILQAA